MDFKNKIILALIFVTATILRFFNLMHDSPYFFNPDERNMANAISQLRVPRIITNIPSCILMELIPGGHYGRDLPSINCNLNPHFFSYGQFPLYLAFINDQISRAPLAVVQGVPLQMALQSSFPSAIFWLRFWSAFTNVLTVLLVYLITNKLFHSKFENLDLFGNWKLPACRQGREIGHYAAILAAFSPGLIQSAHFGTTESLLTLFFLTSVYLSISYLGNLGNLRFIILTSLVIGLALGSKLTGIFFLVPPIFTLMIRFIRVFKGQKKHWMSGLLGYSLIGLFLIFGILAVFILSSPYNLVEPENFRSAVFGYESDVATGKYEAFYTRQFVGSHPILFQAEKIFPYVLGWPVFVLGTVGFLLMSVILLSNVIPSIIKRIKYYVLGIRYEKEKNKNILNTYYLILTTSFFFYLLPNAFLFAKWTRFMTPVLPFFAIFSAFTLIRLKKLIPRGLVWLLVFISILPGIAFMSIYTHEDSRVSASEWIYQNIPSNSYVLSETANVVDIPLGFPNNLNTASNNYTVVSFDFYHLDENPLLFEQLINHLERANYIFIPSRRIFSNYTLLPQIYPLVTKYYQLLNSGALGFEKVSEISSFPKLEIGNWKLEIDDESSEETYTVFDHPVIRIYHRVKQLTQSDYRSLFESKQSNSNLQLSIYNEFSMNKFQN